MPDKVQLRHQDYLIQVGTVQPGQTVNQKLILDNDAGFLARGRAIHLTPPAVATGQSQLENYFDRFVGPDQEYYSDAPTRFYNENANFGQFGNFLPIRQPVYYPPGGTIEVEVTNNDPGVMTGVEAYFRGSKVFRPGALPCIGYPPGKISPFPFLFPDSVSIANSAQPLLNNSIQAQSDSDFIIRAINMGCFAGVTPGSGGGAQTGYIQLYVQFKDAIGKYYSNLPVHVDTCFGSLGSMGNGISTPAGISSGPYRPPLLMPEIYLQANERLFFDLYRLDTGFVNQVTAQVYLLFQGMKVFRMGN
jgi:hypothetical protein